MDSLFGSQWSYEVGCEIAINPTLVHYQAPCRGLIKLFDLSHSPSSLELGAPVIRTSVSSWSINAYFNRRLACILDAHACGGGSQSRTRTKRGRGGRSQWCGHLKPTSEWYDSRTGFERSSEVENICRLVIYSVGCILWLNEAWIFPILLCYFHTQKCVCWRSWNFYIFKLQLFPALGGSVEKKGNSQTLTPQFPRLVISQGVSIAWMSMHIQSHTWLMDVISNFNEPSLPSWRVNPFVTGGAREWNHCRGFWRRQRDIRDGQSKRY